MGKGLAAQYAVARSVFEEADDALGFSLSAMCFEGPEDALKLTENTQPALLTVSTAAFRVLAECGFAPDYVAGHSLGEYSALVAAGSLQFADAVRLVRKRGRYMQEAVPPGVGAMAALLRLPEGALDGVLQQAAQGEVVSAANLNAPDQVVIAGHAGAGNRAIELARAAGARRAILLQVSAPFHCALMKPAQERLAADLNAADFSDLSCSLVKGSQPGALGGVHPVSGGAGSAALRRSGRGRRAHRPAALHRSEPARFALRRTRRLGQTLRINCCDLGPGRIRSSLRMGSGGRADTCADQRCPDRRRRAGVLHRRGHCCREGRIRAAVPLAGQFRRSLCEVERGAAGLAA